MFISRDRDSLVSRHRIESLITDDLWQKDS